MHLPLAVTRQTPKCFRLTEVTPNLQPVNLDTYYKKIQKCKEKKEKRERHVIFMFVSYSGKHATGGGHTVTAATRL